ncbi:MAG: S26 family signal peptidase [Clostridia bacterium]|nr:S26 family signal peptidase [Clostridia bacterium]
MEKQKLKKAGKITVDVITYLFIVLCVLAVVLVITSKRDPDGTSTIFGKQMRYVQSPSMEKCDATDVSAFEIKDIPMRSMVFIETVPDDPAKAAEWYASLKVGDVLTFKYVYVRQETITHRITAIEPKETGGYIISLEGDNKNSEDGALTQKIDTSIENSPNYIIGKVTGQNYPLGLLINALKSPAGIVCIIILPALAIIVLEVIKIVNVFGAERKKKDDEVKAQQQSELEELRARLAQLEAKNNENNGDKP